METNVSGAGPAMINERDLIEKLVEARDNVERASAALKEANAACDAAEGKLIGFMKDRELKSTGKYEGLGFASLGQPALYARYNKPDEEAVFRFVREAGRDDIIKPSIHHANLASLVRDFIAEGRDVPKVIAYGFKETLKLYRRP